MSATFLATVDDRPYFDKVLRFGVENAVISGERFRQILADGAKGIVQIANFFGTAHLRTDLEIARERMVNLLSLYLEDVSDGDLLAAALSLKEKSLLSHSKGGSDMLRRLSALPQYPTIGLHVPLTFDLVDGWMNRSMGGCQYHVAHPGGRSYDTFPVNAYEAEARRLARFFRIGHTPGGLRVVDEPRNPDHPFTLDMRRPV